MNTQILWRQAENGSPVPGIIHRQHFRPFHSMKDPGREAQRLERSSKECNFLVIIGGAALYHIPEHRPFCLILLIIPDRELFLATRDRKINSSVEGRNDIIILLKKHNESEHDFSARATDEFKEYYQPLFHRRLFIYSHRSLEALYKDSLSSISSSIGDSMDNLLSDFLTQKQFGSLWLNQITKNMLCPDYGSNLQRSSPNRKRWEELRARWRGRPVIIAGAGPSLEEGIGKIQRRSGEYLLIASDTALPCLLESSVQPQWVVTVDPQYYSLLHYLGQQSSEIMVFYDIGVNSAITRLFASPNRIPLASLHPLAQWFLGHEADILSPIFYGTNAASACLALALALRPSEIENYGIDFQNSGGRRYSRGSYQHHWSHIHSDRLEPAEYYHYGLATGEARAGIIRSGEKIHYTLKEYERYRTEFESLAESGAEISQNNGYSIIPADNLPMQARPNIQNKDLWKTFLKILLEISRDDLTQFIQRFFSARSKGNLHKDTALLTLMPFFASYCDQEEDHSAFFNALQFARKKISHIIAL